MLTSSWARVRRRRRAMKTVGTHVAKQQTRHDDVWCVCISKLKGPREATEKNMKEKRVAQGAWCRAGQGTIRAGKEEHMTTKRTRTRGLKIRLGFGGKCWSYWNFDIFLLFTKKGCAMALLQLIAISVILQNCVMLLAFILISLEKMLQKRRLVSNFKQISKHTFYWCSFKFKNSLWFLKYCFLF